VPRHVDESARIAEIVHTVLRIAARSGLQAVTFRSVAAALGSSTTVITHFLPDREAMLQRAFDELRDGFRNAVAVAQLEPAGRPRLRALLGAAMALDGDASYWAAYGQYMTHGERAEWAQAGRDDQGWFAEQLRQELAPHSLRVPLQLAVDLCMVTADGITVGVLVDASAWPRERQLATLDALFTGLGIA
jgi:AcrR family transcriptional regulator